MTSGSTSLMGWVKHYQIIGATAREMLISAAANDWGVSPNELIVDSGYVIDPFTNKKIGYGKLIEKASRLAIPTQPKPRIPRISKLLESHLRDGRYHQKLMTQQYSAQT